MRVTVIGLAICCSVTTLAWQNRAQSERVSAQSDAAWEAKSHYDAGVAAKKDGDQDTAIAEFREVVRLQPDNAEAHYQLGEVLSSRGDYDEAVPQYRSALRVRPEYAEAHLGLGKTLLSEGIRIHIATLEKAAGSPEIVRLFTCAPLPLALTDALVEIRKALTLRPDPNWAVGHFALGEALWWNCQWEEALSEYSLACSHQPPSHPEYCLQYKSQSDYYRREYQPKRRKKQ